MMRLWTLTWGALSAGQHRFVSFVIARPIVLILLAVPYLATTIGIAYLCNITGKAALAFVLWAGVLDAAQYPYLDYGIAKFLFFGVTPLVWFHYLYLALRCFRAAVGAKMTVFGVIQLVAVTVFIFAAAHYHVALLSDGTAYKGTIHQPEPEGGWGDPDDLDDRLFFVPAPETVVDFIYFSAVTTFTVGYGDIYPVSSLARCVTIVHIVTSFVLIVVVLGSLIGRAPNLRPDSS
jgi:hypothetical protein